MTASSCAPGISTIGYPIQPLANQTGQSKSSQSLTPRFMNIEGPIVDKSLIKTRLDWLAGQIEKAATLMKTSPEETHKADEGLIKYSMKLKIAGKEINELQYLLSYVQSIRFAHPPLSSLSSSNGQEKLAIDPSERIKNYEAAVQFVKLARDQRHDAIIMHGNKKKALMEVLQRSNTVIDFQITQALAAEKLVLDTFKGFVSKWKSSLLPFLKRAIDNRIEFGMIKLQRQDIFFSRDMFHAQELEDVEKRNAAMREVEVRREFAVKKYQLMIEKDCDELLDLYLTSLHDYYKAHSAKTISEEITNNKRQVDLFNEQIRSKERSKKMQAAYLAIAKDLHSSLLHLFRVLKQETVYLARFSLNSLRRSNDKLKSLIATLNDDAGNLKFSSEAREHCRNIACRLKYEHLQANTLFDAVWYAKDFDASVKLDDDGSSIESEEYTHLRSGYIEILITKDEMKILAQYLV